jgi:hypothetical protein
VLPWQDSGNPGDIPGRAGKNRWSHTIALQEVSTIFQECEKDLYGSGQTGRNPWRTIGLGRFIDEKVGKDGGESIARGTHRWSEGCAGGWLCLEGWGMAVVSNSFEDCDADCD